MRNAFSGYHPVVNFVFFLEVIGISMFFLHPVLLGISLVSALCYSCLIHGWESGKKMVIPLIVVFLLAAAMNALFNHQGITLICYLPDGNPLTLEAFLYGMAAGVMLVTVLVWFNCMNRIMTSDKVMFLFGRLVPSLSLVLSMVFRFLPKFQKQLEKIRMAQKGIGRETTDNQKKKNRAMGIRQGMKTLSILTTWSFETSIETADSMRARGYGLRGRTNYNRYRMTKRDWRLLIFMAAVFAAVIVANSNQILMYFYYPAFVVNPLNVQSMLLYLGFGALCLLPTGCEIGEEIQWKLTQSKI